MNQVHLTQDQAEEMYYQINAYYLFLQCAENVDKCFFEPIKFWNPLMNNHLRKARESSVFLLKEFRKHFKPKDNDTVQFEAPAELYRAMDFFSRLAPETISDIMDNLEAEHKSKQNKLQKAV
ncbi:Uncharacterised protein [Sphingobacterium spiritivorum]|uniref:Uncharacterized protein n=2 Tax=Sphingobacterium spiritivorum TaxID=258 RepID=D7VN32_SPHSI|nr:hypothetical protein HMPREF0766_12402 [Sphingobacterium spiritivorum ATCC 33861]SUJ22415.1 Uncharacterised protein [Sphingobacterium spiritivorum]